MTCYQLKLLTSWKVFRSYLKSLPSEAREVTLVAHDRSDDFAIVRLVSSDARVIETIREQYEVVPVEGRWHQMWEGGFYEGV